MDPAGGLECLALGADTDVTVLIEGEVVTREGAVITLGLVPDWYVRLDASLPEPAEHLAGAVGHIPGDMTGLEGEAVFCVRAIMVSVASTSLDMRVGVASTSTMTAFSMSMR